MLPQIVVFAKPYRVQNGGVFVTIDDKAAISCMGGGKWGRGWG
ncbi:hypothetical protein [Parasphingorhabdus sp.]